MSLYEIIKRNLKETKQLKSNLKETETQAGNDLDEICSYVYNDCDGDISNFPDKEKMEYIADVNGREYNQIKKLVEKAISNVADHLYSYDRWGKENIELSDRATMNYIHGNVDNVDPEESMWTYEKLRDQAFKNFEDETGVEIYQDGRSGRHIVVENNYYNASHYDELCAAQEKWEDWLIDEFAKAYPDTEEVNESQKLKETDVAKNDTEQAYMNYVKEWFDDREFSWEDELSYWSNKPDNWNIKDYKKLFDGLYEENGIDGELFVSYDEWLDNEYNLEESQKLKEAWDLSYDEKNRMYNFITQVYGKNYTERVIDNINTVTDEKITRLYNAALKKFKTKQQGTENKLTGKPVVKDKNYDMEERD